MFNGKKFNGKKIIGSALTFTALFSSVMAFAKDGERNITFQDDVASAELIRLNVPAGKVVVTGTAGNTLTAEITASCQAKKAKESCSTLLKTLTWDKKTGSTTELSLVPSGITNYDDVTIEIKFGVPNNKKLDINLSAGELLIENTSACLNANLNAGEIKIKLKENQLASAELSAKVGDVHLVTPQGRTQGGRSLLVGAKLDWNKGSGKCHTKASTLAGEVQLMLN